MKRAAFFDTNIFLYADDCGNAAKQERAIELVASYQRNGLAMISLQVMQEYFSVATQKLGVDVEVAQRKVELMAEMQVVRFLEADVVQAIELHRLSRISFWDAMMVHAAKVGGAEILFSEDLQDGGRFGGVRVENPFRLP